jgi:NADH:ubiquinone oxidoreductase subunit 6 (subunit J)
METINVIFNLYLAALPIVVFAVFVIIARNPVYSVVSLMAVFCFTTVFLIIVGCDFVAFIFLMVYVGAIAVLFLFVVMMLNIRNLDWNNYLYRYLPLGGFIGLVLLALFLLYFNFDWQYLPTLLLPASVDYGKLLFEFQNIEQVGISMYTTNAVSFIFASIVLLVAMVGAIVLTLHRRNNLKKQSIVSQIRRGNTLTMHSNYTHGDCDI